MLTSLNTNQISTIMAKLHTPQYFNPDLFHSALIYTYAIFPFTTYSDIIKDIDSKILKYEHCTYIHKDTQEVGYLKYNNGTIEISVLAN